MNSTHEWEVTQQMMLGDFNPFHDQRGRFTTGHKFINHTDKRTGLVKASYYAQVAKDLGIDLEQAKELADAVNEYTRHSTDFRRWCVDPDKYASVYGIEAAARQQAQLGKLESFIEKAPKWSGGKLYRGMGMDAASYEGFLAKTLNLKRSFPTMRSWPRHVSWKTAAA